MAGTQNDDPKPNEPNEPKDDGTSAGTPAPEPEPKDDDLKDKHGEQAINRGRYDRDMKAKDDEIARLKAQLEESGKKAESGAEALKKVQELEAKLADEKVGRALEAAGCVNAKAAKALLDDYDGDVAKLKDACPYLFKTQQQKGSTGARRQTPPDDTDDALDRAFGLKK